MRDVVEFDPALHHRRSIRLPTYDYAQPGAYFVTIVCRDRECVFGEIANGSMVLNAPGRMVESVLLGLADRYAGMELDAFVTMPNHVHMIVVLVEGNPRGCPRPPARIAKKIRRSLSDSPNRDIIRRSTLSNVGPKESLCRLLLRSGGRKSASTSTARCSRRPAGSASTSSIRLPLHVVLPCSGDAVATFLM